MNTSTLLLTLLVTTSAPPPQAPPMRPAPTQAPVVKTDYALVIERVRAGETVTISVGERAKDKTTITVLDAPRSLRRGVYRCWRGDDGEAKYESVTTERVTTTTVKGHSHRCPYDGTVWSHRDNDPTASHSCPKCGRVQLYQHDSNVAIPTQRVERVETKPETRTEPPTVVYPLQSVFPQRSNCPDGNCPTATPTRRGLFR